VEHVTPVALLVPGPLLLREDLGRRKVPLELGGHETRGLGPVCAPVDCGSDRSHELVEISLGTLA
jgi:hypothetical protein